MMILAEKTLECTSVDESYPFIGDASTSALLVVSNAVSFRPLRGQNSKNNIPEEDAAL